MALTEDQVADVSNLLQAYPDWPTSRIRAEAGLPPTALFAVKRVRQSLGIPEPEASAGATGAKSAKSSRSAKSATKRGRKSSAKSETETLDTDGLDESAPPAEPTGPGRSNWRPKSLLAPVLPRLASAEVQIIQQASHRVTRGRAPMSRQEAQGIAIPSVRIADRVAAKYIKRSGKVTENQEDVALIVLTLVFWLIGWIVAIIFDKPAQVNANDRNDLRDEAAARQVGEADLFAGSEPAMATPAGTSTVRPAQSFAQRPLAASPMAQSPVSAAANMADADGDESDLFAGSEPLASDQPTPIQRPRSVLPPGATEAQWQAIMPTDLGEGLVS